MNTPDKCPRCGAEQEIPFNVYGYKCGTDHTGEVTTDLCRERTAHAETRRYDVRTMVPGTYGEALQQGWITVGDCEPHEWDNRTSAENLVWIVGLLKREREKWEKLREWVSERTEYTFGKRCFEEMNRLDVEAKEGQR